MRREMKSCGGILAGVFVEDSFTHGTVVSEHRRVMLDAIGCECRDCVEARRIISDNLVAFSFDFDSTLVNGDRCFVKLVDRKYDELRGSVSTIRISRSVHEL